MPLPEVPAVPFWRVASAHPDLAARPPGPPFTPGRVTFADVWFSGTAMAVALADGIENATAAPYDATQVTLADRAAGVNDLTLLADRPAVRSVVLRGGSVALATALPHVEEVLVLSDFGRFDTTVLARLPNLRTLAVGDTTGPPLLTQLAGHNPRLENLLLRRPLPTALDPLGDLPELTRLWVRWAKGGVRALARCGRLHWLHVDDGLPTGWAGLAAAAELRYVRMAAPKLPDLSVVGSWPRLASLDVGGGAVASLAGLERAGALRDLVLRGPRSADLSPLAALTGLRRLAVEGAADWQPDLSALRRLPALRFLRVQVGTAEAPGAVPDLGFLPEDAPELTEVHLPFTVVRDGSLAPLACYPALVASRLFGSYGEQEQALRAARPGLHLDVARDRRTPAVATVGDLRIVRAAGEPPTYSLMADLRRHTGRDTNHEAADHVRRLLAERRPDLAEWVDIDSEAGSVVVVSPSLERLTELARLIVDSPSR